MICKNIKQLVNYGLETGLLEKEDEKEDKNKEKTGV